MGNSNTGTTDRAAFDAWAAEQAEAYATINVLLVTADARPVTFQTSNQLEAVQEALRIVADTRWYGTTVRVFINRGNCTREYHPDQLLGVATAVQLGLKPFELRLGEPGVVVR